MIVTCSICGRQFEKQKKGRTPLTCSDPACREALLERQAEDGRLRHARARAIKRKKKKLTLSQVSDLANKAGMTYGQYVHMMECNRNDGVRTLVN